MYNTSDVNNMTNKKVSPTIDYAIDLGTSDSLIAYKDDNEVSLIENSQTNDIFTPSAVWIDENDKIQVGQSARDALITDPENAYTEFKLNMGFPLEYHFKRSDKTYKPEELSAEILKNLKKSAYAKTNEKLHEIVITIPANSNPLNTKATAKAAKLAGFQKTYFIAEPVAAAIAYGLKATNKEERIWMIYDLGGGTFDTCIVKADEEKIENMEDSGLDNIGGILFDWKIVDEIFKKKIIDECKFYDFTRDNPRYKRQFYILKHEAEEAKKRLSYEDKVDIVIENLFDKMDYTFNYTLTKEELEKLITPSIKKTIDTCNDLLWHLSLKKEDIEKIILVGGATLTPLVTQTLQNEYDVPIEKSLDPLTVVVRGAAIYASTMVKTLPEVTDDLLTLIIYNNESIEDNHLSVSGRVYSNDSYLSYNQLQVKIYDKERVVAGGYLTEDGTFNVLVPISDKTLQYHIDVFDKNNEKMDVDDRLNHKIKCQKNIKGTKTIENSIHLLLHDNKTVPVAKKGERTDYISQTTIYTTKELSPDKKDSITIPVYVGENRKVIYNTLIGHIEIKSSDITDKLDINSRMDISLETCKENDLQFNIYIPSLNTNLTRILKYNPKKQSIKKLENNYRLLVERLESYEKISDMEVRSNLERIKNSTDIEYLKLLMEITRNDKNCIKATQEYMDNIISQFDDIDEKFEIGMLKEMIEYKLSKLDELRDEFEEDDIDNLIEEYNNIQYENTLEIIEYERVYNKILEVYINQNMMETVKSVFYQLKFNIDSGDDEGMIDKLIVDSQKAINSEDEEKLLKNVIKLYYNSTNDEKICSDVTTGIS